VPRERARGPVVARAEMTRPFRDQAKGGGPGAPDEKFRQVDIGKMHQRPAGAREVELEAYKRRMGWSFKWVSSFGSDFNYDLGVSFTPEQMADGKRPLELRPSETV